MSQEVHNANGPSSNSAEERRLRFEERRIALEEKRTANDHENQRLSREVETTHKAAELELRKTEIANQGRGITAPQAAAIGAVMTLIGGVLGAALTGYFGLTTEQKKALSVADLERQKFKSGLIIDALKTNNPLKAVPVLQFYAAAGLIPSYKTNIVSLATQEGGIRFPVNLDTDQTDQQSVFSRDVIATCLKALEFHKNDASAFVMAVASQYGLELQGVADDIVDQITAGKGWEVLPSGVAAAAKARAGWLVIAGLKGKDQINPSNHGHLVIVVDGPSLRVDTPQHFGDNWRPAGKPQHN